MSDGAENQENRPYAERVAELLAFTIEGMEHFAQEGTQAVRAKNMEQGKQSFACGAVLRRVAALACDLFPEVDECKSFAGGKETALVDKISQMSLLLFNSKGKTC